MSISDLKRVAKALDVPLGWFFIAQKKPAFEVGSVQRAGMHRRLATVVDDLVEELLPQKSSI